MKMLFMEKVMDPKKTYHYTGKQLYCKQVTTKRSDLSLASILLAFV